VRFRRRFEPQATINLVPMVDVVFQLVLFFLVATTLAVVPGIRVLLPASGTAERVVVKQLIVTVVSPTEMYVNRDRVSSPQELAQKIAAIPPEERKALQSVIIEGEENIPYALMVQVLDALRSNGLKDVGLRTRHDNAGTP
jgi:biopolymer transport protein ExbD